jgi:hypothetical protein
MNYREKVLRSKKMRQFGKLPTQYNFFLNPYENERFTHCPQCEAKMGQCKLPLVIHVEPMYPISLNYTCRYCPTCDLLIAHQDEIEHLLATLFEKHAPDAVGNEYLMLGTFDHDYWKQGTKTPHVAQDLFDNLHDFKQVLTFQPAGGWVEKGKLSGKRQAPSTREEHRPEVDLPTLQIDNPSRVNELMEEMQARLPIPVRPTLALVKLSKKQGLGIHRNDSLLIRRVFYMGDEGGIMCDITLSENSKAALVCSLTHLEVVGEDALAHEMRLYQQERSRKISNNPPMRRGR